MAYESTDLPLVIRLTSSERYTDSDYLKPPLLSWGFQPYGLRVALSSLSYSP